MLVEIQIRFTHDKLTVNKSSFQINSTSHMSLQNIESCSSYRSINSAAIYLRCADDVCEVRFVICLFRIVFCHWSTAVKNYFHSRVDNETVRS